MDPAKKCLHAITKQAPINYPPPKSSKHLATADSGASGIYIASKDTQLIKDLQTDHPDNHTHVEAAEGTIITSHAKGNISFPGMPGIKFQAHAFHNLQESLLGIGTIIDTAHVRAILSDNDIKFIDNSGTTVLQGPRCRTTGLWNIDLNWQPVDATATDKALAVRPLPMDSVGDLIAWWHASFGYPVASTFLRALASWLKGKIPGVTLERARKYKSRLKSITSAKGHLAQTRQNARSTQDIVRTRTRSDKHNIIVHLVTEQERNDMDLAHQLHDKHLMVFYSHGGNYLHIELADSNLESHVLKAYKQGVEFFASKGLKPNIQRMDGQTSFGAPAFAAYQKDNDITVDLVPPGQHRRNKAERGIETVKHHIIAVLAGLDPNFPMKGLKHLYKQIELTLNLLRPARNNPALSAWVLITLDPGQQ